MHWLIRGIRLGPERCHEWLSRQINIGGDHVPVILVDGVVPIPILINVYLIELVIDFRLKKFFDLHPPILSGKSLRQSQQQLVLITLSPLVKFPERVLQILHGVVPELEQELDDVVGVLLDERAILIHEVYN